MSLSPKSSTDDGANKGPMFTTDGFPLDPCLDAALVTNSLGDGGPTRRIDCCPPPRLISAPSICPSKTLPSDAWQSVSLVPGINSSSLIDEDDDDELMDYFGGRSSDTVTSPLASASPAILATDNAAPTSMSCRWNVSERNIRTLPSFYQLEKSAVFVPQASASILAARVTSVLQARSIAASYDAENSLVDCVSSCRVDFRIRLYRGRGDFKHGIILEVQRKAGFDLSYAHDVFAILDAAEGKSMEDCLGELPATTTCYSETGNIEDMEFPTLIHEVLCP